MGGTVFVLGAGASYGDTLQFYPDYPDTTTAPPPNPPLTNQFFDAKHLYGEPEEVAKDYSRLVTHIRNHWGIEGPFGSSSWTSLSIEDVFTSLALLNDFSPAGTNEKVLSQLLLNDLNRYIRRSIAYSTLYRFGTHTRSLAQYLKPEDSVLSFNYDLLMDRELLNDGSGPLQYQNFCAKFLGTDFLDIGESYGEIRELLTEPISPGSNSGPSGPVYGLYLKLHGSLNWFVCPNSACPRSETFAVVRSVPQSLGSSAVGIDFQCNYCHSELNPFLIPPSAQKPVMNNPRLRNIWGNAFAVLANAQKIVVIGFSFQPSDFYAAWLFRYALRYRKDIKVWVVNPDNGRPDFRDRMKGIFINGYDGSCLGFDQINDVIRA
jgi:hypothetical protein